MMKLRQIERMFIEEMTERVLFECPGQVEPRYLDRIGSLYANELESMADRFWSDRRPLVVTNLPEFENIEKSKIMTLLLGQAIGKCVAYSEYNQSYITDVRPSKLSREESAGTQLLDMHNDLTFAEDRCRPRALVLVAHIASGAVPKTLLAPGDDVVAQLGRSDVELLSQPVFEIRSGGKLRWPVEQVRRLALLSQDGDRYLVRLSFSNISTAPGLDERTAKRAKEALDGLAKAALAIGRQMGHVLRKGEALLIPNDFCLHGRDIFESESYERLLLRSYVVPPDIVALNDGNTMLSLRA